MKPAQGLILALHWFSVGLLQPILSLMLLSRGCNIRTLPLALGLYSLTVLLLEVPSGVFADWRGRKTTYVASAALYAVSFGLLARTETFGGVAVAMTFQGAGRAFSSGSLDALVIDGAVRQGGDAALPRVTAQLMVVQNAGVALGALAGGLLPDSRGFRLHLLLKVALTVLCGLLAAGFLQDEGGPSGGTRPTLMVQLRQSAELLRHNRPLGRLLACMTMLAGLMALVETYWQPAFRALSPAAPNWRLSLLCTGGFLLCTLASLWAGRRPTGANGSGQWSGYFRLQALLGGSALLMVLPLGGAGFTGAYLIFYVLLGISGVREQTLLNGLCGSAHRATLLSVASLACQLGAMGFNAASSPLVERLGFGGVWGVAGVSVIAVCLLVGRSRSGPFSRASA